MSSEVWSLHKGHQGMRLCFRSCGFRSGKAGKNAGDTVGKVRVGSRMCFSLHGPATFGRWGRKKGGRPKQELDWPRKCFKPKGICISALFGKISADKM